MSADPFVAVRIFNKMRNKGHSLRVEGGRLVVESTAELTDSQAEFIRTHKSELVALLQDAEILAALIEQAGTMGLGWREGTDWDDRRLLAAGEILYSQQRMVSVLGRRYSATIAPPTPRFKEASTVAENARLEVEPA